MLYVRTKVDLTQANPLGAIRMATRNKLMFGVIATWMLMWVAHVGLQMNWINVSYDFCDVAHICAYQYVSLWGLQDRVCFFMCVICLLVVEVAVPITQKEKKRKKLRAQVWKARSFVFLTFFSLSLFFVFLFYSVCVCFLLCCFCYILFFLSFPFLFACSAVSLCPPLFFVCVYICLLFSVISFRLLSSRPPQKYIDRKFEWGVAQGGASLALMGLLVAVFPKVRICVNATK